jgi:hypothetical protein
MQFQTIFDVHAPRLGLLGGSANLRYTPIALTTQPHHKANYATDRDQQSADKAGNNQKYIECVHWQMQS